MEDLNAFEVENLVFSLDFGGSRVVFEPIPALNRFDEMNAEEMLILKGEAGYFLMTLGEALDLLEFEDEIDPAQVYILGRVLERFIIQ